MGTSGDLEEIMNRSTILLEEERRL